MNQEGQQQESTNNTYYLLPNEDGNYLTCHTQVPWFLTTEAKYCTGS